MTIKMRVARPTNELDKISEMYRMGLGLDVIGKFNDHEGFDGIILGSKDAGYHLEFTKQEGFVAPHSPSPETLLIFYAPLTEKFEFISDKMLKAGFVKVKSHNPYWDRCGITFEDPEGYRVVLCNRDWVAN